MATRKTGAKKGRTTKKKTKAKQVNPIAEEIVLLLTIAAVALLFLSLLGVCGTAGDYISMPVFGLFGLTGYIVPFVLAVGVFFLVANHYSGASKIKALGALFTLISVSALTALLDKRVSPADATFAELFECGRNQHIGGGVIGGGLAKFLSLFGGGGIILAMIFIIIGLVIVTERSFLNGIRDGGTRVVEKTKENLESYRQESAQKQQRRMEKKVSGIETDTVIPRKKGKTAEVHEITTAARNDKYAKDIFEIENIEPHKEKNVEIELVEVAPLYPEDTIAAKSQRVKKELLEDLEEIRSPQEQDALDAVMAAEPEQRIQAAEPEKPKPPETKPENGHVMSAEEPKKTKELKAVKEEGPQEELVIEEPAECEAPYEFPPITLLSKNPNKHTVNNKENNDTARKLKETLQSFGVNVTVTDVSCGPSVTRYEIQPEQGVKVSKIVSLADDIKLNLAASDIRIEAPIPGKAAVGIEVPNKESGSVYLRELIDSEEFEKHPSAIAFGVGKDIAGKVIVADIAKMPHLLIAGATGSGKSVCINTIIMSILYRARPDEVKLIMVDPKVVELSVYNGIPHLMIPVVTDPKKASQALAWAVAEMDGRYKKFAQLGVRDLKGYNAKIVNEPADENGEKPKKLPQIVIIIDELADLMMVAPGEVEDAICRLAQLARACGIHLIIATQRPSVNVITGLIKANVPSRIAFSVSSGVDSRTILDMNGAEKLLGKGDMLFYPSGYQKPVRVQGAFVSDKEVSDVVEFLTTRQQEAVVYDEAVVNAVNTPSMADSQAFGGDRDAYFEEAGKFIIEKEKASIGLIQRFYKVGFNRAARIMDQLCDAGVVGPEEGTKPRKILMTMEEFEAYLQEN
jgi:S-DNA-T family DNA segregation ATPase FtsK/SpoIIIE